MLKKFAFSLFLIGAALNSQAQHPIIYAFESHGPYRRDIPTPASVLGYDIGANHSTFRDQEQYLEAIALAAKDRVRLVTYGKSVEGRPLRIIVISSPQNISRIESIRTDIGKLADPRHVGSAELDRIVKSCPTITWINHCIHGDETASFEAVMMTLYTLLASQSPEVEKSLKDSVVILNPVYNPDGHERFVVHYNSLATGSPERFALEKQASWDSVGRFNHYQFDMNRDKLAHAQPESWQESAAYLKWNPQVYVDEHGQPEHYFFPPNSMPTNRHFDRERFGRWTEIFGRANGATFDKNGWQYVTRETFDLFYPGYLDSFGSLAGAIGMTYETDGGGNLARRREDDTISTLRDATAHHFETALTTVLTAASHREDLLRDFRKFRTDTIAAGQTDKMKRIVILPGTDQGRANELVTLLQRAGIEVQQLTAELKSGAAHRYLATKDGKATMESFPAGSIVIDLAQPMGKMARAFMEPDADLEPEFVKEQLAIQKRNEKKNDNERKDSFGFYDITAWSLPYTFGLESYWTEDALPLSASLIPTPEKPINAPAPGGEISGGKALAAYVWHYDADASILLAIRLMNMNYRVAVVTKTVKVEGQTLEPGTFVARVSRNSEKLYTDLTDLSKQFGIKVRAVNSSFGDAGSGGLGSERIKPLHTPVIGVVGGESISQTSYGAIWFLFEQQLHIPFTGISIRSLKSMDLNHFNVIILPEGFGYVSQLGKSGMQKLHEWVARGGSLIGIGSGGQWFVEKDADLSTSEIVKEIKPKEEKLAKPEDPDKKYDDEPKPTKPVAIPGAIFRAKVDRQHFLGYGYSSDEIAVPMGDDTFFKKSKKGATPVVVERLNWLLSGFIWPDNTEKFVPGSAFLLDEPIGSGHAILWNGDPTFRAFWVALRRMFLNGVVFGPGINGVPAPSANP